jgi:4-oxalocrotonate tautomerase
MPVIHIATWPIVDEGRVRSLVESVTRAVHDTLGAPLHKISVYITEVPPSRWADAGVLGSEPEFRDKSLRTAYSPAQDKP